MEGKEGILKKKRTHWMVKKRFSKIGRIRKQLRICMIGLRPSFNIKIKDKLENLKSIGRDRK